MGDTETVNVFHTLQDAFLSVPSAVWITITATFAALSLLAVLLPYMTSQKRHTQVLEAGEEPAHTHGQQLLGDDYNRTPLETLPVPEQEEQAVPYSFPICTNALGKFFSEEAHMPPGLRGVIAPHSWKTIVTPLNRRLGLQLEIMVIVFVGAAAAVIQSLAVKFLKGVLDVFGTGIVLSLLWPLVRSIKVCLVRKVCRSYNKSHPVFQRWGMVWNVRAPGPLPSPGGLYLQVSFHKPNVQVPSALVIAMPCGKGMDREIPSTQLKERITLDEWKRILDAFEARRQLRGPKSVISLCNMLNSAYDERGLVFDYGFLAIRKRCLWARERAHSEALVITPQDAPRFTQLIAFLPNFNRKIKSRTDRIYRAGMASWHAVVLRLYVFWFLHKLFRSQDPNGRVEASAERFRRFSLLVTLSFFHWCLANGFRYNFIVSSFIGLLALVLSLLSARILRSGKHQTCYRYFEILGLGLIPCVCYIIVVIAMDAAIIKEDVATFIWAVASVVLCLVLCILHLGVAHLHYLNLRYPDLAILSNNPAIFFHYND